MVDSERFEGDYFLEPSAENEGTYYGRVLQAAVREIQDVNRFGAIRIPVGSSTDRIKNIDALHLMVFNAADNIQLLQYYPNDSNADRDKMLALLKQEIEAHEVKVMLEDESIANMPEFMRQQGLSVVGGFRIGTLENDMRTTEIVYPKVFAELTGDERYGADISALYFQLVYEAFGSE